MADRSHTFDNVHVKSRCEEQLRHCNISQNENRFNDIFRVRELLSRAKDETNNLRDSSSSQGQIHHEPDSLQQTAGGWGGGGGGFALWRFISISLPVASCQDATGQSVGRSEMKPLWRKNGESAASHGS